MKRRRGRPPVYENATQQPALVALRIPRTLETRLRQEASEGGRTMTDILLQALRAQWEHPHAVADLAETQAQLVTLQRQYAALERKSTQQTQRRRSQAATDKKERKRLTEELAQANTHLQWMHERLTVFAAENPELAEENARRYAKVNGEERRRRLAELKEELHNDIAAITGRAHASPVLVRELQIRFHPDKWSQGQLATEVCHELQVVLNG